MWDTATIYVKAGDGGKGAISFRREKFVPFGGPDGGDGGKGGDVYLEGDAGENTLIALRHRRRYRAGNGGKGTGRNCHGANGEDVVLRVPLGTVVKADGEVRGDVVEDGQRMLVARGGKGGRGNACFATSVRQAPRIAEEGTSGGERRLDLELRLVGDVGIIGYPNAGKSSLLAAASHAQPKIGAYAFTTLTPNLGVATVGDETLVLVDEPGLIQGAHVGVGLGEEFLRHIMRSPVLLHLVDGSAEDPVRNWREVNAELVAYGEGLAEKPQVVAVNKMDLPEAREKWDEVQRAFASEGVEALPVSAVTRDGIAAVLAMVAEVVRQAKADEPQEASGKSQERQDERQGTMLAPPEVMAGRVAEVERRP